MKAPGTPQEVHVANGRISAASVRQTTDAPANPLDLQPSLSRLPSGTYDSNSVTFNSVQSTARDDVSLPYILRALLFIYLFRTNSMTRSTVTMVGWTILVLMLMVSRLSVVQILHRLVQRRLAMSPILLVMAMGIQHLMVLVMAWVCLDVVTQDRTAK